MRNFFLFLNVTSLITVFIVKRDEINGGDLKFKTYQDLENSFAEQKLHPSDLKSAVEFYINRLLDPIRQLFDTNSELKKLATEAYPPPKKQSLCSFLHEFPPPQKKKI